MYVAHERLEQAQRLLTDLGIANEAQKIVEPIRALVPPLADLPGGLSRKMLCLVKLESKSHPPRRVYLRDVRLDYHLNLGTSDLARPSRRKHAFLTRL